jgi:hypothetical protein
MPPRQPSIRPVVSEIPRYGTSREVAGLPPNAITISNSERSDAACDLRWYYSHGLGLKSATTTTPLAFGSAAHDALEDLFRWWMETDTEYPLTDFASCAWCAVRGISPTCERCNGTGMGAHGRAVLRWEQDAANQAANGALVDEDEEPLEKRATRLWRTMEGYLRVYGRAPFLHFRIVGVEVPLARPILDPRTGKVLAPESFVYTDPATGVVRLARPGDDAASVRKVKWPYYSIGKLDAVMEHRTTGAWWVVEHKTSASPGELLRGLTVDPQTTGYLWLLEQHAPGNRVGGYLYDVLSSSFQYDPETLKAGGLSKARTRTIPSWRYADTVARLGLDAEQYADHVATLAAEVDPRLYVRETQQVGTEDRERYGIELFTVARSIAALRRSAWLAQDDAREVAMAFPRTPVCRLAGGYCSYRGPCASDGDLARSSYQRADGARWLTAKAAATPSNNPQPSINTTDTTNTTTEVIPWL